MKTTPISFSDEMVRAVLREISSPGTGKTVTRRLYRGHWKPLHKRFSILGKGHVEKLWVRESWCPIKTTKDPDAKTVIDYRATPMFPNKDGSTPSCAGGPVPALLKDVLWRPVKDMPRAYARLMLKVKSTRLEHLHDITEEEARKEGVKSVREFISLWDRLFGEGAWDNNPQVVVISFTPRTRIPSITNAKVAE